MLEDVLGGFFVQMFLQFGQRFGKRVGGITERCLNPLGGNIGH